MSKPSQLSGKSQSQLNSDSTRRSSWLWNWLLLLLLVILVTGLIWWNIRQNQSSVQLGNQQRATALKVAQDRQQRALVASYRERISDMLQHENLLHSATTDVVRVVAQAETITTLQQLDHGYKRDVMLFLVQTQLISNDFRVINLRDANLRGARLHGTDMRDTYLLGADLQGADLSSCNLSYASLGFAHLTGANLQGANLQAAEMDSVDLTGANLAAANLKDAQGVGDSQLTKAKSLTGTILPDGSTHP